LINQNLSLYYDSQLRFNGNLAKAALLFSIEGDLSLFNLV